MLLWCPHGEDGGGCGGSEVPEGECWAPSTYLGRKVGVPATMSHSLSAGKAQSCHPILYFARLTIQSESVAKHPIQRPFWGLEHS